MEGANTHRGAPHNLGKFRHIGIDGEFRYAHHVTGPGRMGLSIFLLGLAGAVIGLSVSWSITELMANHWGWNIHWVLEGFGMILGLVGIGAAFLSLLGLGILILFSPLIALSLLIRGIKSIFKPKSERDADKKMSQVLKEDKQLRKLYKKKGRSKSEIKSMKTKYSS